MSTYQEKRKFKRYETLLIEEPIMARFQIRSDAQKRDSDDWDSADLLNISAGGIFFYSKKDLGIGTLLDLKIDLPKSTVTINCVGEIIQIEQIKTMSMFVYVIEFIDIKEQEQEMLNTLLKNFRVQNYTFLE